MPALHSIAIFDCLFQAMRMHQQVKETRLVEVLENFMFFSQTTRFLGNIFQKAPFIFSNLFATMVLWLQGGPNPRTENPPISVPHQDRFVGGEVRAASCATWSCLATKP